MTADNTATAAIVQLPHWATAAEAAEAYGIASRTLRLWAKQGKIERRGAGRNVRYRLPIEPLAAPDAGMPLAATASMPATPATDAATLRELLEAAQRERIDAERRAAVAEYRAEVAETDPVVVEGLREQVERLTRERDEARADGLRLVDAMRKRHALIQRLTRRLRDAGA